MPNEGHKKKNATKSFVNRIKESNFSPDLKVYMLKLANKKVLKRYHYYDLVRLIEKRDINSLPIEKQKVLVDCIIETRDDILYINEKKLTQLLISYDSSVLNLGAFHDIFLESIDGLSKNYGLIKYAIEELEEEHKKKIIKKLHRLSTQNLNIIIGLTNSLRNKKN